MQSSALLSDLVEKGNTQIIAKDVRGNYHFNGNFKNANDVAAALEALAATDNFKVTKEDKKQILQIFEEVFNHKAFTGRSGTFFGYEGLGSIYWHMVSKLLYAAQECTVQAIAENAHPEIVQRLLNHCHEINEGIGVHKSPEVYGAFPTDPYSHTPAGKGAQQPGMTGQVKEDVLSRFTELGIRVENGQVYFDAAMLSKSEFLNQEAVFNYIDLNGEEQEIELPENHLAFTYCQVPVVYRLGAEEKIELYHTDGSRTMMKGNAMGKSFSEEVFNRSGALSRIVVDIVK